MSKIVRSCVFIALFLFPFMAVAKTSEVASSVMTVKAPLIDLKAIHNHTTKIFMALINKGNKSHELIAATSPIATKIQLHTMIDNNHHAVMKKINEIRIPPHKEKDLNKRGFHIMLIGIKKYLSAKQSIPITLLFKDGSWLSINSKVS